MTKYSEINASRIRKILTLHKLAGTPWETAWRDVCTQMRLPRGESHSDSLYAFTKDMMFRAYHNLHLPATVLSVDMAEMCESIYFDD